jgi:UDP-GlcNAc:undecaprenyl-phosphate GlcNAc-1-phosphate transferase
MNEIPSIYIYFLIIGLSAFFSALAMPRVIVIAKRKRLFDLPDNKRKIHKEVIPNLGGIGIFFTSMIIASVFIQGEQTGWWHYMVAANLILFLIGIKDDIITLTPGKKFFAQILASVIIVFFADIRLQSLHGIFGVYELPYWISIAFSILGCIFVTNAFNLIDGIDGLAGSISVLAVTSLGICLALLDNINAAYFAFALAGSIIGFLRYNLAPAKIFMGDSGALYIGFSISVLCILFCNSFTEGSLLARAIHSPSASLIIALAILFIPIFDSFRVFITRIAKGKHPFHADKTHLHHYLLDMGFSHSRTVTILVTANLIIICITLMIQDYNPNIAIMAILVITYTLFLILYYMRKNRLAKNEEMIRNVLNTNTSGDARKFKDGGSNKLSSSDLNQNAQIVIPRIAPDGGH